MEENIVDRRYLRVLEPWNGGHTPFDTGFGNRLLHLEACYILLQASNPYHFLELEGRYWKEAKYLDMQSCFVRDYRHHIEQAQKWLGTYDLDYTNDKITKLPKIGNETVKKFLKTGEIEIPEPRYYFDFDWDYVNKIIKKGDELKIKPGLKSLRLKNTDLKNAVNKIANNTVGLHIRRGNGVYKSKKNYKELPPSVEANEDYRAIPGTIYKYWNDHKYISIMKEILFFNPKQKFYLSCDLLSEEYEHLKEKYPGTIFTRKDVINLLSKETKQGIDFSSVNDLKRVAIETVIDMFCLSNGSFLVGAPHSTWVDAILRMNKIPFDRIHRPVDEIINSYNIGKENYNRML